MSGGRTAAGLGGLSAVIFDMDGVLIDTEPLWRTVQMERFAEVGVRLTDDDCRGTMGLRIDEVVRRWFDRRPWPGPSPEEMATRIVDGMVAHVRAFGVAMDGALDALQTVRAAGARCAVASSSARRLIDATVERLALGDLVDVVCSAEAEARGKPAPDVYLSTAAALQLAPGSCLAIEDSVNGVLSARAAGMPCVVIPDPAVAADPTLAAASVRLGSLRELDRQRLEELAAAYFA